jgi:uncharacterized membrane-anchored protein
VSSDQLSKEKNKIKEALFCSVEFFSAIYSYLKLLWLGLIAALSMPDVLTKWLAASLFLLQITCLIASICFINAENLNYLLISIIVTGLNTFLVMDIALLLMPALSNLLGRPIRPEYAFATLSIVIIVALIYNHTSPTIPFEYLI